MLNDQQFREFLIHNGRGILMEYPVLLVSVLIDGYQPVFLKFDSVWSLKQSLESDYRITDTLSHFIRQCEVGNGTIAIAGKTSPVPERMKGFYKLTYSAFDKCWTCREDNYTKHGSVFSGMMKYPIAELDSSLNERLSAAKEVEANTRITIYRRGHQLNRTVMYVSGQGKHHVLSWKPRRDRGMVEGRLILEDTKTGFKDHLLVRFNPVDTITIEMLSDHNQGITSIFDVGDKTFQA